jgi:hypothetical protein
MKMNSAIVRYTSSTHRVGHRAERADRRDHHHHRDDAEEHGLQPHEQVGDVASRVTHRRERDAEENREEHHRQQVAARERREDVARHDVQEELEHALLFARLHELRHVALGERADVEPLPGLRHVHHHETDRERERGDDLEVEQRLAPHPPQLGQVGHARDAMHNREEDDRRDHHLHQIDERVTDGLERLGEAGGDDTEHNAEGDGDQHLKGEVADDSLEHARRGRENGEAGAPSVTLRFPEHACHVPYSDLSPRLVAPRPPHRHALGADRPS